MSYNDPVPACGDLTDFNTSRVLLESIGRERLFSIAESLSDLVGTAVTVCETNGDYAANVISSSYCRMLAGASRRLCGPMSDRDALSSGCWLCHESCREASRTAIDTGRPFDLPACRGGIGVYGVPIIAEGVTVGGIGLGYGACPSDRSAIAAIADRYHISAASLRAAAAEHEPRSEAVIAAAKQNLHLAADLIAELYLHKKATAALKTAEAYYRNMFHHTPVMLHSIDSRGRLIEVSDEWLRCMGYERGEVIGRRSSDFLDEDSRHKAISEYIPRFFAKGFMRNIHYRFVRKDESVFDGLMSAVLQFDADGRPDRSLAMIIDISERVRAEETALREKRRAESYLDVAGVMLVALNTSGKVTLINRRGCEVLGAGATDILGKDWFDTFLPPENRDEVRSVADRIWTGDMEAAAHHENQVVTCSGERRWISWHNTVVRDEDGRIVGLLSSGGDITERRKTEQKLRLLSSVIEESSEAVVITDRDEHIIYVNPAFTRITGYAPAKVIGQTPRILGSDRQDKALFETMWAALLSEGVWQGEIWNRRRDGSVYPAYITINAVRDADGEVSSYVAIFSDISRFKQRENELRKTNAELEEFAHVTSHDLREPLRMIGSYLGLIERRNGATFDDVTREYFAFAMNGAEHMDRLIQDILRFSRIGRIDQRRTRIDMRALCERIIARLRPAIEETDAAISLVDPLPEAFAVESEIERLLENLIGNALKYRHPNRPPRIEIGGRIDRDEAVFGVADNGIGLEHRFRDRIFRMFQRLHPREAYGGGTGIGLAICQKVVAHHGGRIWVDSSPGQGSTFTFSLPLAGNRTNAPAEYADSE